MIFLIDYENVTSAGIEGIDKLSESDRVYIFYTQAQQSISFDMHRAILNTRAKVNYFSVANGGKNALDFQLASFLGYLVAVSEDKCIFVVSGDKGFQFIWRFWERQQIEGLAVYTVPSILKGLKRDRLVSEVNTLDSLWMASQDTQEKNAEEEKAEKKTEKKAAPDAEEKKPEAAEAPAANKAQEPVHEKPAARREFKKNVRARTNDTFRETVAAVEEVPSRKNHIDDSALLEELERSAGLVSERTVSSNPENVVKDGRFYSAAAAVKEKIRAERTEAPKPEKEEVKAEAKAPKAEKKPAVEVKTEEAPSAGKASVPAENTAENKAPRKKKLTRKVRATEQNDKEADKAAEPAAAEPGEEIVTEEAAAEAPKKKTVRRRSGKQAEKKTPDGGISESIERILSTAGLTEGVSVGQIKDAMLSSEDKHQFYLSMTKAHGKGKGVEIYHALSSEYVNLKKLADA